MMDGVMNLCRVKFRDHQRLTRGDLPEYLGADLPGHGRRAARRQRLGRRPARQRHPLQAARRRTTGSTSWCRKRCGKTSPSASAPTSACPTWRPTRASPSIGERRKNQNLMWTLINKFAEKYTKRELMAILNPLDVPCGPIMSHRGPRHRRARARRATCGSSSTIRSAASGGTSACRSSSRPRRR